MIKRIAGKTSKQLYRSAYKNINKTAIPMRTTNIQMPMATPTNNLQRYFNINQIMRNQQQQETQQETQEEEEKEKEQQKEEGEEEEKTEEETEIETLKTKLKEQKEAYLDMRQRLARSVAEQEHTRRIARQDVSKAKKFGAQPLGKGLLEVIDSMDKAVELVKPEQFEELNDYVNNNAGEDSSMAQTVRRLQSLLDGVDMIKRVLLKTMQNNDIEQIQDPTGEAFNPDFHEAMMKQPVMDMENQSENVGKVAACVSKGYMIHDRVLRPSKVVVFVDPNEE